MPFTVLIPARLHSSRLPEKPLADIAGKPMVVRTAERALRSQATSVVVACDDASIVEACQAHGIAAVLTGTDHQTGTDRLAEAAEMLHLDDDSIVVNVQGDEPLIEPDVIDAVAQALEQAPDCAIATAAHPIVDLQTFLNPNVVKVVLNARHRALTFSRAPVPWPRDAFRMQPKMLPKSLDAYHHIGLYAYRTSFLKSFPKLEPAPLEKAESLEQLRALWHGYQINVLILQDNLPAGVDTAEDLERVRAIFAQRG